MLCESNKKWIYSLTQFSLQSRIKNNLKLKSRKTSIKSPYLGVTYQ